jgi:hypothetical protein
VQQLVVIENRRPPIPADAPSGLKALIYECWDADPRKRPAFAEIAQRFASHTARFRGCDDGAIGRVFAEELTEDWSMLATMESAVDGRRAASMVTAENADRFFAALRPLMNGNQKPAVFAGLAVLFEKDAKFLASFVDNGLHELIDVSPETMCSDLGVVLLRLFSYYPHSVTSATIENVGSIAHVAPNDLLKLLNLYITADPKPPHLALAYRLLFDHADALARNGMAAQFITQLQTYFATDEHFNVRHKKATISLFKKILRSGDSAKAGLILRAIAAAPRLASLLKRVDMSELLMDSAMCDIAIDLCAKYASCVKYDSAVVKALLCNAQRSGEATRALIAACASEKVAVVTAELGALWVTARLPHLADTAKLLRAILIFPSASERVAALPEFQTLLHNLSLSGDPALVAEIAPIVRALPLLPEFITACSSSNFLEQYYRVVTGQANSLLLSSAIGLTEFLARTAFLRQFLMLLPTLKYLLGDAAWRGLAVSLLATLSVHEPARAALAKHAFPPAVEPLNADPRLAPYVKCFLSYVPANQA